IIEDLVIIRLKGVLTKAERALVKSDRNVRARELIKEVRNELIENGRSILEDMIRNITRRKVKSLHTDISTITGEKIIILTLDKVLEIE
ncbi:MAG TPA: Na-translocating system protein MpsC family protein, partial [Chitinispirillaceae bacterium]|nr:Na-translocating system protein MpsC family protein [Chitinispirillaceae bacterium]